MISFFFCRIFAAKKNSKNFFFSSCHRSLYGLVGFSPLLFWFDEHFEVQILRCEKQKRLYVNDLKLGQLICFALRLDFICKSNMGKWACSTLCGLTWKWRLMDLRSGYFVWNGMSIREWWVISWNFWPEIDDKFQCDICRSAKSNDILIYWTYCPNL